MRVSITITDYNWPGGPAALAPALRSVLERADASRLDTVWVADHLLQRAPGTAITDPHLEAYTTLGFLAAASRRVRLGTLVSAATFRPPTLLVKAVTTLDVLSGGRAWLGVGAGYDEDEAAAMGLPLPGSTAERFERLGELVRLADRMWSDDQRAFVGRHSGAERPINRPLPINRPRLLIGGTGERKTLRLVAEHADACNLFDIPDGGATIRHKLDVLARHCAAVDRPFDEIEKTVSTRVLADDDAGTLAARLRTLDSYGLDHAIVLAGGPWTDRLVSVVAGAAAAVG